MWISLLWAAAVVSAVPVAQNHGDATIASTPFNDGRSFFEPVAKKNNEAPVKDYCESIPKKTTTRVQQTATATFSNQATFKTLGPTIHWSVDTKPAKNVVPAPPETDSKLYYGVDDPSQSGHFAFLTYNFTNPSVNLDHCDHVDVAYSRENGLETVFNSDQAFKYAKETWHVDEGLVLVATAEGCGDSEKSDRCYFKVSDLKIETESRKIVATGEPKHPDTLISSAETEWGWWDAESTPPGRNSTSTHGFDQILDRILGYDDLDDNSQQFLNNLAPGDLKQELSCASKNGTLAKRNLSHLSSRSFWSWIKDNIVQPIVDAYHTVRDALTIRGSIDDEFSWDLPGPEVPVQQSAWGDAILLQTYGDHQPNAETGLAQYMDIFCVGCGVSGQAKIAGRAGWTPLGGFVEGHIELHTNVKVALKVGIDAQIKYKKNFDTELFNVGLPGLSYGVVTIGPSIAVSSRVAFEAAASGKLLVGAEMGLENAKAVLDIIDSSKSSSSGWNPYFKPTLEAEGELMLAASLGLPVSIRCGLQVSQWQVSVGLIDEPSVSAIAQFAGSMGLTESGEFTAGLKDIEGCAGISAQVSWRNKLYVDILGLSTIPLHDTDNRPLLQQCISFTPDSKPSPLAQPQVNAIPTSPGRFANVSSSQIVHQSVTQNKPHTSLQTGTHAVSDEAETEVKNPILNSTETCDTVAPAIYNENSGLALSPLVSTSGMAKLIACSNGNMYAAKNNKNTNKDCTEEWAKTEDATVGFDGAYRSMHYYSDTMDESGVSRVRLSAPSKTPKGGVAVALVAYENAQGPDFYIAADRHHQIFYPIVCDYQTAEGSKVFLAKDPVKGLATLQSAAVINSITGGKIERCYALALSPI